MLHHSRLCLFLGVFIVVSCNTASNHSPTSTTEQIINTPTATPAPLTCTVSNSELPIISAGEYEGWCEYGNAEYGFSLAVPPDWNLLTPRENFISVFPALSPTITLTIGYRQNSEDIPIQRTGVGAGRIMTEGTMNFLGEQINRNVLVYEDATKALLYNNAVEIAANDLVFTLSLDDWNTDYEAVSLSQNIQDIADRIVESIQLK